MNDILPSTCTTPLCALISSEFGLSTELPSSVLHFCRFSFTQAASYRLRLRENLMGHAPSMLTQYDIEDVQEHCDKLFNQQEIISLYQRFCQLDRNAKGFISADEFMSVPEFAMNPLAQRLLKMVDGLNFKEFVGFLSSFSGKASIEQKVGLIFKIYDSDGNGKVTFSDILEVLGDMTGSFLPNEQREEILTQLLQEAGYTKESYLLLDDFVKIFAKPNVKMEVEVPVD